MASVALSTTAEHLASKQRFSPDGDEAPGIEILGVKGPQSHEIAAA